MRSGGVLLIAGAAACLAAPVPARAQIGELDREVGENMLGQVFYVLDSLYFDSSYGEPEWAEHWWPARERVRQAGSYAEIIQTIANAVYEMGDSHTRFIPPGLTTAADYGWRWRVIGDACYVVAVDGGSDARRQGLRVGDRVLSIDGLEPTRANLDVVSYVYHELSPRQGMTVEVEHVDGSREAVQFEADIRQRPPVRDLSDLETRRRMLYEAERAYDLRHRYRDVDSVAVWHFNGFEYDDGRIDRYMRRARDRGWLVLDLRGNGGGVLETAGRLLGHFTDTAYTAYTQVFRDSITTYTVEPRDDEPFRGRTVVLLDSESASSAEIVAWLLREYHGATILGDRSAGKVRGSLIISTYAGAGRRQYYPFGVQVTAFDIVMPDGTTLEGPGLVPDEVILPTGEDLAEERDPVLRRALVLAGIEMSARDAWKLVR